MSHGFRDRIKKCTKCKNMKPLNEFYQRTSGYYLSECKECSKAIQKQNHKKLMSNLDYRQKNMFRATKWSLRNPEKSFLNKMNYYNRKKKEVLAILGNKCFICEKIPKRFNCHEMHGRKHPITWAYILKNIHDFVLLCNRCHMFYHEFIKNKEKLERLKKLEQMA